MKPKLVVLASGSGSNFQSIIDAINLNQIDAQIVRLIASRNDIGAIEKSIKANIPFSVIRKQSFPNPEQFETTLLNELMQCDPDLIVLAGYLNQIPDQVIKIFQNKIINIHPSLLPLYGGKGFYGIKVHQAVIADQKNESGCTVHWVTSNYDEGPIIAQSRIPVDSKDTAESLASKVLKLEHQLLPKVIKDILEKQNS
ncbi:MAG TPA: phosphoribosylglycinamide formyltransferase [Bacteroidetes bacterium]|nr:phosphoribosylglycinamide formyltransferase [Bacteroidota bacterium]